MPIVVPVVVPVVAPVVVPVVASVFVPSAYPMPVVVPSVHVPIRPQIRVTIPLMKQMLELVVTPPAGVGTDALDAMEDLHRAFARGPVQLDTAGPDAWWFRRFGIEKQTDWPAAAWRATAGSNPPAAYRLCADPVYLQASGDAVVLDAAAVHDIGADEARALVERLNAHFQADGLRFRVVAPNHWLMESGERIDATTVPTAFAHARSIEALLPQGAAARLLKRIGNEAQMLLHDTAINSAREARGGAPVNGVWLWGGAGATPNVTAAPELTVLSDALHVRGIAQAAGARCGPLPANADSLPHCNGPLAVDLAAPFADPAAWPELFLADWLAPLRAQRRLVRVVLNLPQATLTTELFRADPWRWLRRSGLGSRLAAAGIAA